MVGFIISVIIMSILGLIGTTLIFYKLLLLSDETKGLQAFFVTFALIFVPLVGFGAFCFILEHLFDLLSNIQITFNPEVK